MTSPGLRTVQPPEGTEPSAREPVTAKAQQASIAEERLREIGRERRAMKAALRALDLEEMQQRDVLSALGREAGE